MKTVLITGANGFIAGLIAARLRRESYRVVGTARSASALPGFDVVYQRALGQSLADVFDTERIAAVVHAANHTGHGEYEVNTEGTLLWFHEARERSVPLQVFLSSISAAGRHPSDYGRAKRDIETRFLDGGTVVRLGLVLGNGGVFRRMIDSVQRWPVLPLLDGGRTPVHVVDPTFLCSFLADRIRLSPNGAPGRIWHLHQPAPLALRDVLAEIRAQTGASCRFVPVPSLPVLCVMTALERAPFVKLPVNSTNVRGLRESPGEPIPTDFVQLGGVARPLRELVRDALAARDDS